MMMIVIIMMKDLYSKAVARNDYASVGVLSKNFILDQNDIGSGDDDSWFIIVIHSIFYHYFDSQLI